jgi:hypothetical protein
MTRRTSAPGATLASAAAWLLAATIVACTDTGTTAPTPVATTVTVTPTSGTLTAVDATLQLSATVQDQNGQTMSGQGVTWSSGATGVATVDNSGLVKAVANGTVTIHATAGSASGQAAITVAQAAKALVEVSGDQQSGTAGLALSAPLVVQANDSTGHPVQGVSVTFAAANGGSVNPTSAPTGTNGQVQTTWTLGGASGQQSATATANGLSGSPVSFSANATTPLSPTISSITPDTLVEGQSAVLTGTNFDATAGNNVVTIDGTQATVTLASSTSLTVTVPTYGCAPARLVTVSVTVATETGIKPNVPLHPSAFVNMAVGDMSIVQDPTKFCLNFRATATGAEQYAIGMSAPAETPGTVLPFTVTATGGMAAAAAFAGAFAQQSTTATPFVRPGRQGSGGSIDWQRVQQMGARMLAESKLRQWERDNLPRLRAQAEWPNGVRAMTAGAPPAGAPPSVGDTITIRYPDINAANPCSTYVTVKTVVRVVGASGIWLYDVQNPTTDSLTLADIQNASDQFDLKIFASDTTQFGHPTDIDANGHVLVVLTWQVNKTSGSLGGFVWSGDLFPGSTQCPQSNGGELYYGEVPDPLNQAGTGARTKSSVASFMPVLIAHEFTHVIQFGQRLILTKGQLLASWEAEGQATLAEELAGNAVLGNSSGQNYGGSVGFGSGKAWYQDELLKWAEYYGDLGSNNQAANAPELCTVYGSLSMTGLPCNAGAFYGASWILQRYIADQFGPTYPGGLVQLTRDWVSKNPSLAGSANIQALTGADYDSTFARFAAALAVDDRNNGTGTAWVPTALRITSWNSDSIATTLNNSYSWGWLNMPALSFGTGSASRSVRGGSTAYMLLSAGAGHVATAFDFTDAGGAALSTALGPTLWVVRIK